MRRVAVGSALLAGAVWAALGLRGMWFFYDEWGMVQRVMTRSMWGSMTTTFNGHLWMLQDPIYRTQIDWFGLDRHLFVSAAFVVSLVLLHGALAALFRACTLPLPVSLSLAGLLTYLGPAAQNTIFAVQVSPTLALAMVMGAAWIVRSGGQSTARALGLAVVLIAAICTDSGVALSGVSLVTVLVIGQWRGWARLSLAPPIALASTVFVFADRGPSWSGTLATRLTFAIDLFLHAIGSLVGAGRTTGMALTAIAAAFVAVGFRRRVVSRSSWVMLAAGGVATAATVAAIAQTRADLVGQDFVDYNRYLQNVSVPLVLALAPVCTEVVRAAFASRFARSSRAFLRTHAGAVIATSLVSVAWLAGLHEWSAYRNGFSEANRQTKLRVLDAATILAEGCPDGAVPKSDALPAGTWSVQVTTDLVRQVVERGALTVPRGRIPHKTVVEAMCSDRADG